MVKMYANKMEKVTFNISSELKEQVLLLKDELQVSLSAIYNDAITAYLKEKELDKWHKGVSLALEDKEYRAESSDWSNSKDDVYEY